MGYSSDLCRFHYTADECRALLALETGRFVRQLFAMLLKRRADEGASRHYEQAIRTHGQSKMDVLFEILGSSEARSIGVVLDGLPDLAGADAVRTLRAGFGVATMAMDEFAGLPWEEAVGSLLHRLKRNSSFALPKPQLDTLRDSTDHGRFGRMAIAYKIADQARACLFYNVSAVDPHLVDDDGPVLQAFNAKLAFHVPHSRCYVSRSDLMGRVAALSDREQLIRIYHVILRRSPDYQGYLTYLSELRSGSRPLADLVDRLAASDEARGAGIRLAD